MTSDQQRIIRIARKRFEENFANTAIACIWHKPGGLNGVGIDLGLLSRSDGHSFIVRESVAWWATKSTIRATVDRMTVTLAKSMRRVLYTDNV